MYQDYLKGKVVALVGPANYLQGRGDAIDGHDIVVRVNHVCPIPKRYGTRTDVLYHGVWNAFRKRKNSQVLQEIRQIEKHVDWIVFRNSPWQEKTVERVASFVRVPWTVIDSNVHDVLNTIRPPRGSVNTGVAAIIHLLSYDIKVLHVYGFDFYQSGVFDGYGDLLEGQDQEQRSINSHNTGPQVSHLAKIEDDRFKPDEVLRNILRVVE